MGISISSAYRHDAIHNRIFALLKGRMFTQSLSWKILGIIIGASTVISSILTVLTLYVDYKSEMSLVDRSYSQLERLTLLPLSAAVWSYDDEQIHKFLDSIVSSGDFTEARLMDVDGSLIFSSERADIEYLSHHWLSSFVGDLHYSRTFTIRGDRAETGYPLLGQLTVKSSKLAVINRLSQKLLIVFGMQAIKTLVVSLVILIIFEKIMTRHLRHVAHYLTSLRKHSFRKHPPLQLQRRSTGRDELSTLEDSLNSMIRELQRYQNASAEQLRNVQAELEVQRLSALHSARLASLGELAAGIAHEINNPLAIIMGSAQRQTRELAKGNYDQARLCSTQIIQTGERIAKVISSLRKLARDGQKSPRELFDLEKLVQEVVILCEEKIRSDQIKLTIKLKPGIRILANEVEVSQIIFNLLSNAVDAVHNLPDRWIEIDAWPVDEGMVIAVTDSGSGIPPELVGRIMEPFFTTKDIGKGTGLGLSISLSIAKRHSGDLRLNTESPHTSFEFWLPLSSIHSKDGAPASIA